MYLHQLVCWLAQVAMQVLGCVHDVNQLLMAGYFEFWWRYVAWP
jgi:hypothetical protein